MPAPATLVSWAQEALVLSVLVSLPIVAVAALVGLLVAVLQAATQVQDATIAHLPRMLATAAALAVLGGWMGHHLAAFATRVFSGT